MSKCNCPKCNFTGKATGTKTLPTVEEILKQATARQESLLKELRDIGPIHDTPIHDTTMTSTAPAPSVGDAELEELLKIVSESGKIMQTAADAATSYMRAHMGSLTYDEQLMYYPLSVLALAYLSYDGAMQDSTERRTRTMQFQYQQDKATLAYNFQAYAVRLLGAIDDLQCHRITRDEAAMLTSLRVTLKHVLDTRLSQRL